MASFVLPSHSVHVELARRLTGNTAALVTRATFWSGEKNREWAQPVAANAWTSLLTSAFNMDRAALLEVEVRLGLHGIPPEGVGALPGRGMLWLLAQQQEDRFQPSAGLWLGVREHLRPLANAQAALDAMDVLLSPSQVDPWGFDGRLHFCFMRPLRDGVLGQEEQDYRVAARFLGSPTAFWRNSDVASLALTFAEAYTDPNDRLRCLGALFNQAPEGYLKGAKVRPDVVAHFQATIAEGARLAADDTDTVAVLMREAPDLLAQLRAQSIEAPAQARPRTRLRS